MWRHALPGLWREMSIARSVSPGVPGIRRELVLEPPIRPMHKLVQCVQKRLPTFI